MFYIVSVLRINLFKSNLFGTGVQQSEVFLMASITSCSSAYLPIMYLGMLVGESMVLIKGLETIIDRFRKRLSSRKLKLLSIGCR